MTVRIVLADDHQLIRQGLSAMLKEETDFTVVGEAENGLDALRKVSELHPDVLILDVGLPQLNGVDAARRITHDFPHVRIVALSIHTEQRVIEDMLRAGAHGYLPKNCAFNELAEAVRTVFKGNMYLSPTITRTALQNFVRQLKDNTEMDRRGLSPRERQVLQLVAEGQSSKDIAGLLSVSVNTVVRHRQNIMDKLELRSIADLTRYAVREGLIDL